MSVEAYARVLYFRLSETKPSRFRQRVRRSIPQFRFAMDGKIFRIALRRITCPQMGTSREAGINYRETRVYIGRRISHAEINICRFVRRIKMPHRDRSFPFFRSFPSLGVPIKTTIRGLFTETIARLTWKQQRRNKRNGKEQ